MKILIIDNYDSFTFNLYQYCGEILEEISENFEVEVIRNDEKTLSEIKKNNYDRIIISPGPGAPDDPKYFGVCGKVINTLGLTIPVLGVCLGMQGIGYFFGGKVIQAKVPTHGKTSTIKHTGSGIFSNLPQDIEIMRYHSLIVEKESIPKILEITAETPEGEIMGLRHKNFPIEGIQFHPESFATEGGKQILKNFLLQKAVILHS